MGEELIEISVQFVGQSFFLVILDTTDSVLEYSGNCHANGSPVNYLDEFDRHFSRRHRFVNCFIPRFDLEEDERNFYLYGEIPGATVGDIKIEAHNDHTLVIWGKTTRTGPEKKAEGTTETDKGDEAAEGGFVKVQAEDHEHEAAAAAAADGKQETGPKPTQPKPAAEADEAKTPTPEAIKPQSEATSNTATTAATPKTFPPPPEIPTTIPSSSPDPAATSHLRATLPHRFHGHHDRHPTVAQQTLANEPPNHILLSERLVGDFHRTFAFPSPVDEDGVKASMENGVLSLVVPKRGVAEVKKGRRIPIVHGKWWKGEDRGSGFAFAGAAV